MWEKRLKTIAHDGKINPWLEGGEMRLVCSDETGMARESYGDNVQAIELTVKALGFYDAPEYVVGKFALDRIFWHNA